MTEAEDIARLRSADDALRQMTAAYIIRHAGTVVLHQCARLCGVLPPRYDTSEDAGRPYPETPEGRAHYAKQGWDDWSEGAVGYDRQEAGWPRRPEAQGDRG